MAAQRLCAPLCAARSALSPAAHPAPRRHPSVAMRAAGGAPSPQQPGQPAIGATAAAAAADAGGAAIVPPIEKVCRQVGGHPTELLELPATACERPDVQLLVMPGNPGAALYYTSFMRELHSRLHGRASVHAVSNLGMDSQGLTPRGRVHSLQEQVEHKAALLRERYVGEGRPPLVLLAHSIGTYMAIHAVERLEKHHLRSSRAATAALDAVAREEWEHPGGAAAGDDGASLERVQQQLLAARAAQQAGPASGGGDAEGAEDGSTAGEAGAAGAAAASNVIKVCGLYPFLEVDPACSKQRRLQRLARYHAAFSRLSGVLGAVLPRALLQRVVRLASPDLEPHAVDTTLQVFTDPDCVNNGLYMGLTEFEALAAPADWWLLRALGPRFCLFAAPNDVWFKEYKWEALRREVPGVEAYWVEGQSHAFCVSQKQSAELAARLVPIVEAALRGGVAGPAAEAAAAQ